MRVIGIDPGYAIVGYGILEYSGFDFRLLEYGAVTTPAHMPFPQRLSTIYNDLTSLLEEFSPQSMSIEKLFFTSNQKTVIDVAQARGIVLLSASLKNIPVYEYTPLQVKQAVVGYGKAKKNQVMDMTRRILHMKNIPKPDDAADALAIAICHCHTSNSLLKYQNV